MSKSNVESFAIAVNHFYDITYDYQQRYHNVLSRGLSVCDGPAGLEKNLVFLEKFSGF